MNRFHLAAFLVSTTVLLAAPSATAQSEALPQVSFVTLQVVRNSDGSQSVITPKGDLAILPGHGVNGNVAEIYMGSQGGFWYTDKTGQTVDLTPTVQALRARRAQSQQAVQAPQYAPEPYEQAPAQEQAPSSSGGRPLGTAAAAGVGAMVGSALSNHYYNAPYGTPMYYGPGGRPYYYGEGERREFEELNPNQKAVIYNKRQMDQQNQQQAVQKSQANRQARQDQAASNQQSRQQPIQQGQASRLSQADRGGSRGEEANFQRQQQWYQEQRQQNPQKWQKTADNPFVTEQSFGNRGARESAHNRAGREGPSQRSSARGGRSAGGGGGGGGRRGR